MSAFDAQEGRDPSSPVLSLDVSSTHRKTEIIGVARDDSARDIYLLQLSAHCFEWFQ